MSSFYPLLALLGGGAFLAIAANRLVAGAVGLARHYKISPMWVGLVVVGFGTAAPELFVSIVASFKERPEIAVGAALGSNIVNLALVLGIAAMVSPLVIQSTALRREFPILLVIVGASFVVLDNNEVGRLDGVLLWAGLIGLFYWMAKLSRESGDNDPLKTEILRELPEELSVAKAIIYTVGATAVLTAGSMAIVWGASELSVQIGLGDLVVSVTLVALATSLPELVAVIVSVKRKEHDLAVGQIIGSNMFNLLGVLGLSGIIHPAKISPWALQRDLILVLFLTALVFLMARSKPDQETVIQRWEGGVLVVVYIGYLWLMFVTTMG